jgi:predicted ATP-grasp superfamily ATP-dependent carboligase
MRVFVYEYLTALGIGRDPADPLHPLFREGRAMRDAVADDFGRIPGIEVVRFDPPVDRDEDHEHEIWRVAEECDYALVIAPELGNQFECCCWGVWTSAGRLLGPSIEAIRLTTDKFALAEHWRRQGVHTPATTNREPTVCEAFPVVWKPRDGAGSTATFLLNDTLDLARAKATRTAEGHTGPMILQEFVRGRAASVAFLCGPAGQFPLVPCLQHLSDDGRFKYLGGELPIPPDLAERAVGLARRAIGRISGLRGYVGVDLVLGDAPDGAQDYAIEINPRLTTSYVGLRAQAEFNIAAAMLLVASGEPPGEMPWKAGGVRFLPDGTVHPVSPSYQPDPGSHGPARI